MTHGFQAVRLAQGEHAEVERFRLRQENQVLVDALRSIAQAARNFNRRGPVDSGFEEIDGMASRALELVTGGGT